MRPAARVVAVGIVLSAFCGSNTVHAYVVAGAKWAPADIPVDWRFNSFDEPDLPGTGERDEARAAYQAWEDLSSSSITFNEVAAVNITSCSGSGMFLQDVKNVVTFADPCDQLDAITLGLTALYGRLENLDNSCEPFVRIVESDMVLSEEHSWVSHADAGKPSCSGSYDMQVVVEHEAGHFLGLDHSTNSGALMWPFIGPCEPAKASLHADDQAGAACIYPTVTPSCITQAVAAVSDAAVCLGEPVTLLGGGSSMTGCTVAPEYRWTGSNGFLRDWSPSANASDTPLLTTDYTLEIRCTNPVCSNAAAPVTVVVTAPPLADAGVDGRVCSGTAVTLGGTPAASGGTPPYVRSWTAAPSDPTLTCSNCDNPGATPVVTTRYTLDVVDSAGCVAPSSSILITVDPSPQAAAGSDRTLCLGDSTTLGGAPTAAGGTPPLTIAWSATPSDPTLTCPGCDSPTVTPGQTTNYRVDVTDARGCIASAALNVTIDTPALPLPVGNSLVAVRAVTEIPPAPDDIAFSWSSAGGSAVNYRLRRSAARDFPIPTDDMGTGLAGPALILVGEVRTATSPLFYRVAGINCAGTEGP